MIEGVEQLREAEGILRQHGELQRSRHLFDDVVLSGGVNVGLAAVERRVREHHLVHDAAVVGVEDAEWGSRVSAFAVADPVLTLDALRDFVAAELPRTWAPRDLTVLRELPLLDNGKVDRQALRGRA